MMQSLLEYAGRYRRAAVAAGCAGAILYLALLMMHAATRKPWNDEAMSARAGFNLGDKGHTGVEFYDENTAGFPGVHRQIGRAHV